MPARLTSGDGARGLELSAALTGTVKKAVLPAWTPRLRYGEQFDVILCDVMMPTMSGIELHRQLEAIAPAQAARIIFLSGGAFSSEVREFLDHVDNLRVDKPFDALALEALLDDRLKA